MTTTFRLAIMPIMLVLVIIGAVLGVFDGVRDSARSMLNLSSDASIESENTVRAKTQMMEIATKIDADIPLVIGHTRIMKSIWSDTIFKSYSESTRKYVFSFGESRSFDEAINLYLNDTGIQADITAINSRKLAILAEINALDVPPALTEEYTQLQEMYALYDYYTTMLAQPYDSYESYVFVLDTTHHELMVAMHTMKVKLSS